MPPRTAPVHMISGLDVTFDWNITSWTVVPQNAGRVPEQPLRRQLGIVEGDQDARHAVEVRDRLDVERVPAGTDEEVPGVGLVAAPDHAERIASGHVEEVVRHVEAFDGRDVQVVAPGVADDVVVDGHVVGPGPQREPADLEPGPTRAAVGRRLRWRLPGG